MGSTVRAGLGGWGGGVVSLNNSTGMAEGRYYQLTLYSCVSGRRFLLPALYTSSCSFGSNETNVHIHHLLIKIFTLFNDISLTTEKIRALTKFDIIYSS